MINCINWVFKFNATATEPNPNEPNKKKILYPLLIVTSLNIIADQIRKFIHIKCRQATSMEWGGDAANAEEREQCLIFMSFISRIYE